MKLKEITRTIIGTNDLHCLVNFEYTCGKVYFVDNTRGICTEVKTQKQLDRILQDNNF